jgi:type I restriction enzyme, S subunit
MYRESWGRACYAGYLVCLSAKQAIATPEFILYFTSSLSYRNWLSSVFIQATIQNVSAEKYANLSLALPSILEQKMIIDYLDQQTARIDALISRIQDGIKKLKEYSTALISAAVTGKIDVRDVAEESLHGYLGEEP